MLFTHNFKAITIDVKGLTSENNERRTMEFSNRLAMALYDAAEYNRKRGMYATADRYQSICNDITDALEHAGFYSFNAERKGV